VSAHTQRENRFDFKGQAVAFSRNYLVRAGQHIEKDTKTGEDRWVSLDPLTCDLFAGFFERRRTAAKAVGVEVPPDAYVFSPDPLGAQPWHPDTMTHRYERYAAVVGIESPLKELRHYSATQLLTNGVDLSTVAGRLGHADGSTTLRFYAQFVRPADQHAAALLSDRLSDLRKKEQLRVLFVAEQASGGADLMALAEKLAPLVGLDQELALTYLAEMSASKA
jgi:integrase